MNSIYTKNFLINTLDILEDNIRDIEKWNAYNDDEYQDEAEAIKTIIEVLKAKITN